MCGDDHKPMIRMPIKQSQYLMESKAGFFVVAPPFTIPIHPILSKYFVTTWFRQVLGVQTSSKQVVGCSLVMVYTQMRHVWNLLSTWTVKKRPHSQGEVVGQKSRHGAFGIYLPILLIYHKNEAAFGIHMPYMDAFGIGINHPMPTPAPPRPPPEEGSGGTATAPSPPAVGTVGGSQMPCGPVKGVSKPPFWVPPWRLTENLKMMVWFRWCSSSGGVLLGSMLIFRGVSMISFRGM